MVPSVEKFGTAKKNGDNIFLTERKNLMSKVAVVYWSGSGNTLAMAEAVLEGAKSSGAEAELIQAGDFGPEKVSGYTGIAFGCPAMGAEQLEESEFEPMWQAVKGNLIGKRIGLFGSYGWGDGEWMRVWHADAESEGIGLCTECVLGHEAPDEETLEKCRALGQAVAA